MGATDVFDLFVIGSGPGGQKAAIQAAKLGKNVGMAEKGRELGGVCVNTGTIPSKTIREAVMYLTGLSQRGVYGDGYRVKDEIRLEDLMMRVRHVVERERGVIRDQLLRNHVNMVSGTAGFVDEHTLCVRDTDGVARTVEADKIVIATGSRPAHPPDIDFDGNTVLDSDDIVLRLTRIPGSLVVVGAGVIGVEFASMFAALGTKVTLIDGRPEMLEFCDAEVVEALRYHLRDLGVVFRFGERVTSVVRNDEQRTLTSLASGKAVAADAVFYAAGRRGATDELNLEAVGIAVDGRGRIAVDSWYRTSLDHVYAVGDVIGFPSLASASADQGRIASAHACGIETNPSHDVPIGIFSIPEVAYVGKTEAELTNASIPYEVGISHYRELARGLILSETHGLVKLLVSPEERTILGVHAVGANATEVVHIGQAVMGLGGTVDFLVDSVFNYPTLAEAYKVAALDAINKLRAVGRFGPEHQPSPLRA